jgi:hypothetical protein
MSSSKYFKAKSLIELGQVYCDINTPDFKFFTVMDYTVTLNNKGWSCSCQHGSLWSGDSGIICSHIKACKMVIKNGLQL